MSILLLTKNFRQGTNPLPNTLHINLASLYRGLLFFSIPVLFINSGIALLNNLDIILVKHFFTPYDAGIYAGAVTMSKVYLFGASIVQVVMFPQIAHLHAAGVNFTGRFAKFLVLQLLLIFGGLAIFTLVPQAINTVMFGGKFTQSVTYLPLFSCFIALYILITFLSMFLLAINKTKAFLFILPACALQYLLITLFHTTIFSVIKADILTSGISCLLISIYVVLSMRTPRHGKMPV